MSSEQTNTEAEELAQRFHETYERLAPSFGYSTRVESAVPWADVPEQNKALMTAVADAVIAAGWRKPDPAHDAEVARQALLGWADYQQRNKGIFDYALDEDDLKDIDAWCSAVRHYADGRFPIAVPVDEKGGEHV